MIFGEINRTPIARSIRRGFVTPREVDFNNIADLECPYRIVDIDLTSQPSEDFRAPLLDRAAKFVADEIRETFTAPGLFV